MSDAKRTNTDSEIRRLEWSEVMPLMARQGEKALLRIVGKPWIYEDQKRYFELPTGMVFDGASVPNLVWPILDATALDLLVPGGFHDGAYRDDVVIIDPRDGSLREREGVGMREDADKVLSKLCQYWGCDWDDTKKIYYGVRIGGGRAYQKKPLLWLPWQS